MKGPALDVRPTGIESITPYWIRTSNEDYDPILRTVPEPLYDANIPKLDNPAVTGTAIFVGVVQANGSVQTALYQHEPRISQGINADGTTRGPNTRIDSTSGLLASHCLYDGSGSPVFTASTSWVGRPFRVLVFDTELSEEQTQAVINWLMDGHYLDPPGTPIGKPDVPPGRLGELLELPEPDGRGRAGWVYDGSLFTKTYGSGPGGALAGVTEVETSAGMRLLVTGSWETTDPANTWMLGVTPYVNGEWYMDGAAGWSYPEGSRWIGGAYKTGDYTRSDYRTMPEGTTKARLSAFTNNIEAGSTITITDLSIVGTYPGWQDTKPEWEPDTSIWRTYLEVRDDGTYRYRAPTRIA